MAYVENIRIFVRVYELGSMSAAARDQRVSAAVASARIADLERHLKVRLFNRTTRKLQPTAVGDVFYKGAVRILETIDEAEAALADLSGQPRGSLHVAAPLGIGKRLVAPLVPLFRERYPEVEVRLRLSDRPVDMMAEGLDVAFHLGPLPDSALRVRRIAECRRVLCAAPSYVAAHGMPERGQDLVDGHHRCLLHRYPGAREFVWTLETAEGPRRFEVEGPLESDDGDVLTSWALAGHGIVMKPLIEVAELLARGELVVVAAAEPPGRVDLACLFPHKRLVEPKSRAFIDFAVSACRAALAETLAEQA